MAMQNNTIMENLLKKVDIEIWDTGLLSNIVSFHSDSNLSIHKDDDQFTKVNNIENTVIATKGWDVQGKWVYQLTDWIPLILIKEYNTVEVAWYSFANGYNNDLVFC